MIKIVKGKVMEEIAHLTASQLLPAMEAKEKFELLANQNAHSEAIYQQAMREIKFGKFFGDHMASIQWNAETGWYGHQVVPYAPITIEPGAGVIHYGQEIFEGMKAYRHEDGSIWTFRPGYNAARMRYSAQRLALPELSDDDFIGSLAAYIALEHKWVPAAAESSLYLRPFMFSTESFLGMRAGKQVQYLVIGSPSGTYFTNGFQAVDIWVTQKYHRAAAGGTGSAKCGGNYAGSLLALQEASAQGYSQVLFLDAATNTYLEEIGGMNIFVVYKDGTLSTPALNDSILAGGTRGALIVLAREAGLEVREEKIALSTLLEQISAGEVSEVFACGTAAVVFPIGRLAGENFNVQIAQGGTGKITEQLYRTLLDIQYGRKADTHDWMYRIR